VVSRAREPAGGADSRAREAAPRVPGTSADRDTDGPGPRTAAEQQHPGTRIGPRLRIARQVRGLSQQQLAGMAGVSRQAVSAVESGLSDPSLRVALALSRALGLTVEELFGPSIPEPVVPVRPVEALGAPGSRVALAPVGDTLVALPLSGPTVTRVGFVAAGGRVAGPRSAVPMGPPRPTLVVAGCDPALPLLELPLSLLDPPVSFLWWRCASREALALASDGLVHVAGVHLRGPSGEYNTAPAAEVLPGGGELIGFCTWREGLVLRPELTGEVADLSDAVRAGLRLVNREPGAEARAVLDRELAARGIAPDRLPGYHTRVTGHLEVAAAIAAGLADVGIASEPAALAYGLGFVPLTAERFDLVVPAAQAGSREIQGLHRARSSRWLHDQLASLPGYRVAQCGERLATIPAAPSS
jgi:putative molybdopterin biosynthesis protein